MRPCSCRSPASTTCTEFSEKGPARPVPPGWTPRPHPQRSPGPKPLQTYWLSHRPHQCEEQEGPGWQTQGWKTRAQEVCAVSKKDPSSPLFGFWAWPSVFISSVLSPLQSTTTKALLFSLRLWAPEILFSQSLELSTGLGLWRSRRNNWEMNDFPTADKPPGDTVASLPGFPLNSHGHKAT